VSVLNRQERATLVELLRKLGKGAEDGASGNLFDDLEASA
jgi:hypothetical protein